MTERSERALEIIREIADQPQTNQSLALLDELGTLLVEQAPKYVGMGETRDDQVKRWMAWD